MALARHHAATVQSVVDVFFQLSISWFEPDVLDHSLKPVEHFLVGQPVQGTSKSTHRSRVCLLCVRQCGSDQVRGVRRHIAAFVVGVDRELELHQVAEASVGVADHLAEIIGQTNVFVYVYALSSTLV